MNTNDSASLSVPDPVTPPNELEVTRKFWLREVARYASPATSAVYDRESRLFVNLTGITKLSEFNRETVRRYLDLLEDSGKYGPQSVHGYLRTVKVWWNWLLREDYEVDPKVKVVKGPKLEETAPDHLTPTEIVQMVEACGKTRRGRRDSLMIRTFYTTGIRLAELSEIRGKDIQVQGDAVIAHIRLGKGGKDRFVVFPEGLDQAILKWANLTQPEDPLFWLTRRGVYGRIKTLAKRSGLTRRIYPHLFRHSFATEYMEQEGSDSLKLQKKMGHTSLTMTRRYVKFAKRSLRDVVKVADPTVKKRAS